MNKKKQLENWFEQNPKLTNLSYGHIQPVYIRAMWPMTVSQMTSDQRVQERMRNHKLWFSYLLSLPIKIKRFYLNPNWKIRLFLLLKRIVIGFWFIKSMQSFLTVISFVFWLWKRMLIGFKKNLASWGTSDIHLKFKINNGHTDH